MGGGVGIKILDSSSICHPGLVRFLRELAERKGVKYQMEVLPAGGTDAGGIQLSRSGTPRLHAFHSMPIHALGG